MYFFCKINYVLIKQKQIHVLALCMSVKCIVMYYVFINMYECVAIIHTYQHFIK